MIINNSKYVHIRFTSVEFFKKNCDKIGDYSDLDLSKIGVSLISSSPNKILKMLNSLPDNCVRMSIDINRPSKNRKIFSMISDKLNQFPQLNMSIAEWLN